MIAVDTNLLVYSHRPENAFYGQARKVIDSLRAGAAPWAIPWPCIHEFVGIVTHPRIFKEPTPIGAAFLALEVWQDGENLHLLAEGPGYQETLRALCVSAKLAGPRVHDARIAALCLRHGVSELWSADRDFSAFPQLKVSNPLVR